LRVSVFVDGTKKRGKCHDPAKHFVLTRLAIAPNASLMPAAQDHHLRAAGGERCTVLSSALQVHLERTITHWAE